MHVIRPVASELIAEGVMAMEFGASSERHRPHLPCAPDALPRPKEAALAVDKRTLNF